MSRSTFPDGHVAISGRQRQRGVVQVKHTRACSVFDRLVDVEFVPAADAEDLPECAHCTGEAAIQSGTMMELLWKFDPDEVVG